MTNSNDHANLQKSVRRGTATRQPGKETAARLVEAAYELLESQNLERFSMRSVAQRADVSLANLQYYFPTRSALDQALYFYIEARDCNPYEK